MKVKFKDGNIVEAIQYKYRDFEDNRKFILAVNDMIRLIYPATNMIGGQYTVKSDNSLEIVWETSTEKHTINVPEGGYVYSNPRSIGIWSMSYQMFHEHAIDILSEYNPKTSIQYDIKALERKISKHLQELGAVSGEFLVGGNPVKFMAVYEIDFNDLRKIEVMNSPDELIEKFKKAPWKFTDEKGGRRG